MSSNNKNSFFNKFLKKIGFDKKNIQNDNFIEAENLNEVSENLSNDSELDNEKIKLENKKNIKIELSDWKVSKNLISLLKENKYEYFEDLNDIDLKEFINDQKLSFKLADELLELLIFNNIPFKNRIRGGRKLKEGELSSKTLLSLYESGLFYKECLNDIDLRIFSKMGINSLTIINEIINYSLKYNKSFLQRNDENSFLKDYKLSNELLSLLYSYNCYYKEDLLSINLNDILNLKSVEHKIKDELVSFLYKQNNVQEQNEEQILQEKILINEKCNDIKNDLIIFDDNLNEYDEQKTLLSSIKISKPLLSLLQSYKYNYLEDLENKSIKDIINSSGIYFLQADELVDLVIMHGIQFEEKIQNGRKLKKGELSSSTILKLYKLGFFYKECLKDLDLRLFLDKNTNSITIINELINYCIKYNKNFNQRDDSKTLLKEYPLSFSLFSLLYSHNCFYKEDIATIDLNAILNSTLVDHSVKDELVRFLYQENSNQIQNDPENHMAEDNINNQSSIDSTEISNDGNIGLISSTIQDAECENKKQRILWDEYQVALLIDTFCQIQNNKISYEQGRSSLSKSLREYAIKNNVFIDEAYRNENGIGMCLQHIHFLFSDGNKGLSNVSSIERMMVEMYQKNPMSFNKILTEAKQLYEFDLKNIMLHSKNNEQSYDYSGNDVLEDIDSVQKNENVLSKIDVVNCPFSARVLNVLLKNNIKTLYELRKISNDDLLKFSNFGKGSLTEIQDFFVKCEQDNEFWYSILSMNSLPSITSYEDLDENEKNTSKFKETIYLNMPDSYYESILNIEGLSDKALGILKLKNIRKVGQLIQYSLDSLFFDNAEYKKMLDEAISRDDFVISAEYKIFDEDIKIITNYLKAKGIYEFPVKLSLEDNKKLMPFTLEETIYYGWANIIFSLLNESFEQLKPNAKSIVFARNGIYCECMTLEEIGGLYNVTRERIRQIESKSLGKIKKFLNSSGYIDVINSMTVQLFENVGPIYKIRNIEGMKNYLKLVNKIDGFNFIVNEDFWWVSLRGNWVDEIREELFNALERDNKLIGSIIKFKEYLCKILKQHLNTDTEFQVENFNSIVEDFMQDFIHNYLIRVDNEDNYKVARNKIRSNSGKITIDNRNEEIIALFEKIYPNGVHLPIDKDSMLKENLKPLLDSIPYKISIRTLSDGILKNAPNVILWDKGLYIHVNNINIKWSVVDDVINEILSEFDRGLGHFSIKKIYDKRNDEMQFAGIPNPDALIGLITYKNNPRIGHRKLEVFDTFDDIPDDLSKTEIIENYLKDKGDWVSVKDMQKHFCDEIGWEDYQVEQYVGNSIYAKKDTKLGFIHLKSLIAKLNKPKLQELLELLYNQTDFSKEPIKLEAIRRSSFNKTWVEILGCDVTGNFMSDLIDSLALKNLPLIFYQGSVYPESYISEELVAKCNVNDIFISYNSKTLDDIYSEFQHFDRNTLLKIIDSDIKITTVLFGKAYEEICNYFYAQNIQDLGVLLFFPYNSIEFKKKFSNKMIKKVVEKIYSWIESFELKQDKDKVVPSITNIFWS